MEDRISPMERAFEAEIRKIPTRKVSNVSQEGSLKDSVLKVRWYRICSLVVEHALLAADCVHMRPTFLTLKLVAMDRGYKPSTHGRETY